jgi:hypothetical protein
VSGVEVASFVGGCRLGGSRGGKIGAKLCGFKFPGGLDLSFAHF